MSSYSFYNALHVLSPLSPIHCHFCCYCKLSFYLIKTILSHRWWIFFQMDKIHTNLLINYVHRNDIFLVMINYSIFYFTIYHSLQTEWFQCFLCNLIISLQEICYIFLKFWKEQHCCQKSQCTDVSEINKLQTI